MSKTVNEVGTNSFGFCSFCTDFILMEAVKNLTLFLIIQKTGFMKAYKSNIQVKEEDNNDVVFVTE